MRFLLLICALMIMAILTMPVVAQEIHADLCLHGCPSGSPEMNDILIRDIYILSGVFQDSCRIL